MGVSKKKAKKKVVKKKAKKKFAKKMAKKKAVKKKAKKKCAKKTEKKKTTQKLPVPTITISRSGAKSARHFSQSRSKKQNTPHHISGERS